MEKSYKGNKRGFTLVEVMVVIIIIGIISSFAMSGIDKYKTRGRDLQRLSDLERFKTAVELYASKNGFYPKTFAEGASTVWACFTCAGDGSSTGQYLHLTNPYTTADLGVLNTVFASYINKLIDPKEGDFPSTPSSYPYRGFIYASDGYRYKVLLNRTPENLRNYPASIVDPSRCGGFDSSGICNAAGTIANPGVQAVALWSDDTAKGW